MTFDIRAGRRFPQGLHATLTSRGAAECDKWTFSAGDDPAICDYPILLSDATRAGLFRMAEQLATESEDAERELRIKPELWPLLGLSPALASAMVNVGPSNAPRYSRVDFHPTDEGVRITENNCDVAGGLLEASGLGAILASLLGLSPAADPAGLFARAFLGRFGSGARIGLCHLASYADDRQVVRYLSRRLREHGLETLLFDPRQLRPGLRVETVSGEVSLDGMYRFLPGDWLEQLPESTGWRELFSSERVANPLTTLLVQSKRFPLAWAQLHAPLTLWKQLLPTTEAPQEGKTYDERWVLKPAFGHEGANVRMEGITSMELACAISAAASDNPREWVAQRRFHASPIETPDGPRFVVVGVFVIEGRASGTYARASRTPLIDGSAQEAVVLAEGEWKTF